MKVHGAMADEWFDQSRESRIFMTAGLTARQLIDAMTRSDQQEEMKRERERNKRHAPNRRPPRRGRR